MAFKSRLLTKNKSRKQNPNLNPDTSQDVQFYQIVKDDNVEINMMKWSVPWLSVYLLFVLFWGYQHIIIGHSQDLNFHSTLENVSKKCKCFVLFIDEASTSWAPHSTVNYSPLHYFEQFLVLAYIFFHIFSSQTWLHCSFSIFGCKRSLLRMSYFMYITFKRWSSRVENTY